MALAREIEGALGLRRKQASSVTGGSFIDGPLIVAVRAEKGESNCVAFEHMYGANPAGFSAIGADRFVRHRLSLWAIEMGAVQLVCRVATASKSRMVSERYQTPP